MNIKIATLLASVALAYATQAEVTSTYTVNGIYTNTVPNGVNVMYSKLWGAGGGGGDSSYGGGGAFAQKNIIVTPGQQLVVVVGQGGGYQTDSLGGAGNGISRGGNPAWGGNYNGRGQGGQASSLFLLNGGMFVTKAVAAGGGGAGSSGYNGSYPDGGAGGNPGAAGKTYAGATGGTGGYNGNGGSINGGAYSASATTSGVSALVNAGGNGGNGGYSSGGGGGGYGGGGGGNYGTAGGGGGGSCGDTITGGNSRLPGNTGDGYYGGSAGYGAGIAQGGTDGRVVLIFDVLSPTPTTLPATGTTSTGAMLNGLVNPNNIPGAAWFQYGLSTNYGLVTASSNFAGVGTNVSMSIPLSGLAKLAVYHCRLVAANSASTNYGADISFITMPPPPVVATLSASGLTRTNGVLNGTVDPKGGDAVAWFCYGTTTNYGAVSPSIAVASTNPVPVAIAALAGSLAPGTTYHFQVVATNAGGLTYGNDVSFNTLAPSVPTVVTVAATNTTRSRSTLMGTAAPNGADSLVWFRYGTTTAYGNATEPVSIGWTNGDPVAVSCLVTGLWENTRYHFQAVATNRAGISYGEDIAFTTASSGPPGVATLPATSQTRTNALMNGTVDVNGADSLVWFRYGTSTNYGSETVPALIAEAGLNSASISALATELLAGTVYHFQLVATNRLGISYGNDLVFATTLPSLPAVTTLAATGIGSSNATLCGQVDYQGPADGTAWFEYGLTTNYGSSTAPVFISHTNVFPLAVKSIPGALQPLTDYHFRMVAANAAGTNCGGDLVLTTLFAGDGVTNCYTSPAIYTNTVPAGANLMIAKLWGAGGGGGQNCLGGGGAFVQKSTLVSAGQTFVAVVGQGGAVSAISMGGANNTITMGGAPGYLGDYNYRGQGGQASALFGWSGGLFVTKAVAGAGGGAGLFSGSGGGAGGSPGGSGAGSLGGAGGGSGLGGNAGRNASPGASYSAAATSTGITALSMAQGNGGSAAGWSGGGGGGYGGGGGAGTPSTGYTSGGGGGGGSFGDVIIAGTNNLPGNSGDASYLSGVGKGGGNNGVGANGLVVVIFKRITPLPITLPATGLAAASALLNGTVNPNGAPVDAWFEYGLSTDYGQLTTVTSFSAGTNAVAIGLAAAGLSPLTIYHCRLVAAIGSVTNYGADVSFTTPPWPPVAATAAATAVTRTNAVLNGYVEPKDADTTAWFRYGTTTNYGNTTQPAALAWTNAGAVAVGALANSLIPGTVYHFQLVATNSGGVVYGEDLAVTTLVNAAPVAGKDQVGTTENRSVDVLLATLLANDSDLEGDPFGITAVASTSASGGSLVLQGNNLTYTPPNGFSGTDQFSYTLTDGLGATNTGVVTVTVSPAGAPAPNRVSIATARNGKLIRFAGLSGQKYIIQSAEVAAGPYADLSPQISAGPTGVVEYEDTTVPPLATRFYRTVAVP